MKDSYYWDIKAEDWDKQVGEQGDRNRRFNSDPYLWKHIGNIEGKMVLDAGCGTGYLSMFMASKGAIVTAVDYSEKMIEVAKSKGGNITYKVNSCETLEDITDVSLDLVVSNYVLMDLENLQATCKNFYRVLKQGGVGVFVFSHPCFPQDENTKVTNNEVTYKWINSYFEEIKYKTEPWAHFTSDFIYYQRPLSSYFNDLIDAGFVVTGFEEPRVGAVKPDEMSDESYLSSRMRPFSVLIKVQKL